MARIRSVKPDFFTDEDLQDLEAVNPGAYVMLVFAGLWGNCDKQGVFEWKPRTLKRNILPFLPYEIEATLALLEGSGFVLRFTLAGRVYGYVPTFREHQRINGKEKQAPALYPSVPEEVLARASKGKHRGSTGEAPGVNEDYPADFEEELRDEQLQGVAGEAPGKQPGSSGEVVETTGREGKGRERKGREEACLLSPPVEIPPEAAQATPGERAREPTRSEVALRECVAEKRQRLEELFPGVDIGLETEELVAKYGAVAIGADPWLIVLRWFRNLPKGGGDGGGQRPGGGAAAAGGAAPVFTDRTTEAFCGRGG